MLLTKLVSPYLLRKWEIWSGLSLHQQNQPTTCSYQAVTTPPIALRSVSNHYKIDFHTLSAQEWECCQVKYLYIQPHIKFQRFKLHVFGLLTSIVRSLKVFKLIRKHVYESSENETVFVSNSQSNWLLP